MNTIVYSQLVYLLDESFQSELPKSWDHCSTNWGGSEIWHIDSGYLQESMGKYFGRTLNGLLLPYVELDDIANPILEIEYALGEIKSATQLSIYYTSNDSCTTLKNWNLITSFNKTNDIKSSKWIPTDMDFKTIQVKLNSILFKSNTRIGIGSDYKNGFAEGKFYIKSLKIYGTSKAKSQTFDCVNKLDTAEIIKIAKKESAWWDKNPKYTWDRKTQRHNYPKVLFDEKNCEWRVYSIKAKQTRKGGCELSGRDCKQSTGCTVTKSITLIIDANSKKIKGKKTGKSKTHNLVSEKDELSFHYIEREQPVQKIRKLVFMLDVYERINDSTLSENSFKAKVVNQEKDTLELYNYLLNQINWKKEHSCEEGDILMIPSTYFYSSKVDSTGHFRELEVIRSGSSANCTDSFKNKLTKSIKPLIIMDEQHFNKNICFRLEVQLE